MRPDQIRAMIDSEPKARISGKYDWTDQFLYNTTADMTAIHPKMENMKWHGWMAPQDLGIDPTGWDEMDDIWGYVSPSGREYALAGYYKGLKIVEVTDPANLKLVFSYDEMPASYWKDYKVNGHYAYGVADGTPARDNTETNIWIFDLENIDQGTVVVHKFLDKDGNAGKEANGATHNLELHNGILYRLGGVMGIRAFDVRGAHATSPKFLGKWGNAKNLHP